MTDDVQDSYLDKSPLAGRMGQAVEYLVAASRILWARGELSACRRRSLTPRAWTSSSIVVTTVLQRSK